MTTPDGSPRAAAIDCGTNSIRLLIAERDGSAVREIDRDLFLTRLGQGVDATGEFAPDALARTLDAVADFAGRIRAAGVDRVRFVATSAARDAGNRADFLTGVRDRLGVEAEIIPGEEEARLSFAGALAGIGEVAAPVLVMDIGGGSTELVLGRPGSEAEVLAACSLDVGSVRLRERLLHADPPTAAEVAEASAFIDDLLDSSGVDLAAAATWIGVGGTATSLAAINLGLDAYDRAAVHGSFLTRDEVQGIAARLLAMPVAEVTKLPTMQPRRADVIGGGALIAARVGLRCRVGQHVSEADILDGLVLDLLARPSSV